METIKIKDCKVVYQYLKKEGLDKTIVFIHGWMDTMYDSEKNFDELSKSFNVLRFDLPGHGDSSYIKEYTFELYVEYTKLLLDVLNITRCTLIGHSMGSVIANELYKTNPELIDKVILLDPPLKDFPNYFKLFIPIIRFLNFIKILPLIMNIVRHNKGFQNKWCNNFIGVDSNHTKRAREITIEGILKVDMKALIKGFLETLNNTIVVRPPLKNKNFYLIYGEQDPVMDIPKGKELFISENIFSIEGQRHTPNRLLPNVFNNIIEKIA